MSEFQVMTGNDLRSGRVVYLDNTGDWTDEFLHASQLTDGGHITMAEKHAQEAVETDRIVDPYLVKVVAGHHDMPSHVRERIRRTGPTCLPSYCADVQIAG